MLPTKAPSTPPAYTLMLNTDTAGADLVLDSAMPDLVVPASTAAECAAACALVPECKAFTLASTTHCAYRLGENVPGCCYLKPANGWNATAAPGLVSGVLKA